MGNKSRVRPGLTNPDPSQDVENTLDQQIDEGQHERDEKESGGPLGPGPAKDDEKIRSNRKALNVDDEHKTPEMKKGHRGGFP